MAIINFECVGKTNKNMCSCLEYPRDLAGRV